MKNAENYGIKASNVEFDLKKITGRGQEVSNQLVSGIKSLLKKNKIKVIEGAAKLEKNNLIIVDDNIKVQAQDIIIATGARARILPGFEPDGVNIWSYREALRPKKLPKSMVIVGSGAIGIEFASFYNALGVEVKVLEAAPRILPAEDEEISQAARKAFEGKGIKFITDIKLLAQNKQDNMIITKFENVGKKEELTSEILLLAVGIIGNIENIGLEQADVKHDKNHILTDEFMQTNQKHIYAIGDVAGAPWLAHKASHEGIIAVEKIAGLHAHTNKQK